MSLFKDVLKDSESLIIDEIALDFEYIPKILKHRENEQKYVAECIKPLLQERNGKNLFIFGKSGVGKTAAIKWILRDLENETDVIPVYINCWKTETNYKIINEICRQIGYKYVLNKKTDELIRDVSKILNKKSAVLVFDEVDKLIEQGVIYSLVEDIYKKTIILITNNKDFLSHIDQRVRSRLILESLEFKPYNKEETRSILKERTDYALVKDVFDDASFNLIADRAFELGDIRTGLHLIREAVMIAENNSCKNVKKEFIEEAIKKLDDFKVKDNDLDAREKLMIELVKLNPGKNIKELHTIFTTSGDEIPYRTFFEKIKKLEKKGALTTKETEGTAGKATIVGCNENKKIDEF
ncbi:AAA family ATPase [Candidatus Woesearchaeota archaeon]|nr:AAA family ATPase [Candidatus Woesearchaeota archaeon]